MARRTVSAAERKRIAEELARAANAGEREAVRIVREVWESIKDLPPEEALAVFREALGPMSERLADSVIQSYEGAAALGQQLAIRHIGAAGYTGTGTWLEASQALRARYAAQGGIRLSSLIHQRTVETYRQAEAAVRYAVWTGRSAMETAERLRDIGVIPETQLPKVLREVRDKARATMAASGDPRALREFARTRVELDRASARLERYAARLRRSEYGMGAATEHAADAIRRAVARNNDAAVERALHWHAYDKQAYQQRVIARTEIARGYSEGFKANADEPWVVGFKWNVETGGGRKRDVCDVLGNQNPYGLGPGCYPFDKVPELPAHPNCNCYLTEVIDDSVGEDEQRPAAPPRRQGATAAWLKSQPASVQREILGAGAYASFRESEGRELPAWLRA